ncbi:hypothetical protein BGZ99_000652 [Dissophora globulifera]|uniref:Uncharacterized protein n=1 Tax=Dissophora globulifera TaxID=979702 RepID=A0A9P6RR97_9FUNG|nr:hypothetical protein BGZ99_000652 [Dissophora globulifera]
MAMAIAQADLNQAFSASSAIDDLLQSPVLFNSSMSASNRASSSSSSAVGAEDAAHLKDINGSPMLARLLSNRDLFPMIVSLLDTRSLLALASTSSRFHRDILLPPTPNLSCINLFLQQRTVVCPMAQFESLKDFMVKYRSFKPLHLHFTYSERSSLMSLVPEVTAPIYNSKQDSTFTHPSSSPLTSSHLFGVNQSISIHITSANSLVQHHHPLTQEQQQQQQHQQLLQQQEDDDDEEEENEDEDEDEEGSTHNQHENDQLESIPSISGTFNGSKQQQHATTKSPKKNSGHSEDQDERKSHQGLTGAESRLVSKPYQSESSGELDSRIAAMTISPSITIPTAASSAALSQQQQHPHLEQQRQQQRQQPRHSNRSSNSRTSSNMGSNNHHSAPNNTHHSLDLHSASARIESNPLQLSSPHSIVSPPNSSQGQHGFELSYWQKFALNELFMRLLPFLRTLTIGRTDKPSRRARARDPMKASGELSAGVCFFLARCFNVMHDMPDTALESVIWMDVTIKDVALLVTMVELRDIMVDERYWKRGYWATERPSSRDLEEDMSDMTPLGDYEDDDEDDWDGFYYMINQEGADKRSTQTLAKSFTSTAAGKAPQRKSSAVKGGGASSSSSSSPIFLKKTVAPLPSQQQVSGLGHLVKSASSSTSSGSLRESDSSSSLTSASNSTQPSSIASSTTNVTPGTTSFNNNRYYYTRSNAYNLPPPAAWQGYGDGVSETNAAAAGFVPEPELHPAVQLYEALKEEISDAALVSRTLDKGKHLAMSNSLGLSDH